MDQQEVPGLGRLPQAGGVAGEIAEQSSRRLDHSLTVAARFNHERAIAWTLRRAHWLAAREAFTATQAALADVARLVKGRTDPVGGHAARVALGLGGER